MTQIGKLIALLFYTSDPIERSQLCKVLDTTEIELNQLIERANQSLTPLGLNIIKGHEVLLTTQSTYADLIEKFYQTTPQPLSSAALEVLSVIAYNQPISKIAIDEIRGVGSEQSINNLLNKHLIKKSIQKNETVFSTTTEFLKTMGIINIKDLPKPNVEAS